MTTGGIRAGYFNDVDAALAAVELVPDYKAAWATLNPIDATRLPLSTVLNPSPLFTPAELGHGQAANEDIERRIRLLVDFDPPREPKDSNSTDGEKQAAWVQAEECRAYLRGLGWPEPLVGDSGNGWHLQYAVELANTPESAGLLKGVLAHLAARYPMVDAGNFNAARVCKLYGTMTRKGPHSDERPHRRSAIVEPGSGGIVTDALLRAQVPTQADAPARENDVPGDGSLDWLVGFLDFHRVPIRSERRKVPGGWQVEIECPWVDEHSSENPRDTVVSVIDGKYGFRCLHSHCTARNWRVFRAEVEQRTGEKYQAGPEGTMSETTLPSITHADLAAAFLRDNHDYKSIYNVKPSVVAQWLGTRWDISGDDRPFRRAVADYLKGLFDRYPEPEKGRDTRRPLKDSWFVDGVVKYIKLHLPAVRIEEFDRDEFLLGLPKGRVIDLRTGGVRDMRREDFITKRIYVSPDPNCPTPRFDRFLREITEEDSTLAGYLLRLGALCLTAKAQHGLFFLHGTGRNGKGVFVKLLCWILGEGDDGFAHPLRPNQLAATRSGDDSQKRTIAELEGKRLITVNENTGAALDFNLLKTLSGGDALNGRRMRGEARTFTPTHKILIPTNERPHLPADPAFRGRVHMIPFKASFLGREDSYLESTLRAELPGVLHRLLVLCPDVIENGLQPPPSVLAETGELFAELDVTAQFKDACLEDAPDSVVPHADMVQAITVWAAAQDVDGDSVQKIVRELKARPGVKYGPHRIDGRDKPAKGYRGVRLRSA